MARGDFIEVTYRTGQGTDKQDVIAEGVGGSVAASGVDGRNDFITIEALDRNGNAIRTARFAKSEVVAIVEGHRTIRVVKVKK
jgi:hypothetical protein